MRSALLQADYNKRDMTERQSITTVPKKQKDVSKGELQKTPQEKEDHFPKKVYIITK